MTAACPLCVTPLLPYENEEHNNVGRLQLSLPTVRCAACIATIENSLRELPGIDSARVNLTLKRVAVETDLAADEVIRALDKIGYEAHQLNGNVLESTDDVVGRDLLMRLGVAGFAMMNAMLLSVAVWSGAEGATRDLFHLITAAIALPAALFSAQPFFSHAWKALRVGKLNMDVPISLAILLASGMSLYESLNGGAHAYFDAALSLTFFLLIGRYLDYRTRAAAKSAAKDLAALEVHTAQRKANAGYETVSAEQLAIGDTILVPTGARVAVDGELVGAQATTDRSFLTGESDPALYANGQAINAGEINFGAAFELRATAVGHNTRLRQISTLVETAENARNSYTSLADRAARAYAPLVHLLAAATFVGWIIFSGDVRQALNTSIAVLIITCPCALGLAVPAVSTAAISKLYKLGFLVKSGTALERLADSDSIVFDKTGTLTQPSFGFDFDDLSVRDQQITKALAQTSAHPLSKAIVRHLDGVQPALLTEHEELPGRGITASYDGVDVALGSAAWLGLESDGLALRIGDHVQLLEYQDQPIEGARDLVAELENRHLPVEILSGDTAAKTARLAGSLGIDHYGAGLSPEGKKHHVDTLVSRGQKPCMVGDGLNDTAALASAHASVAPGTALEAARNAADVVLLGDAIKHLPKLINVSRWAARLSRQNFAIATAYNLIAIPIAVAGFATPLLAALAMSTSSLTVLANAMRIAGKAK